MTLTNAARARKSRGDRLSITATPAANTPDNLPSDGVAKAPEYRSAGGEAVRNSQPVVTVSRRLFAMNMLVSATAIAAATPAASADICRDQDPIFAAIERCRSAEAASDVEAESTDVKGKNGFEATRDVRPARETLAQTVPTTPAGFASLTAFLAEMSRELEIPYFETDDSNEMMDFIFTLDRTARAMVGQSQLSASPAAKIDTEGHSVLIMELLPPAGPNSGMWSGFAYDGASQRWAFGADNAGEICFTFREDRSTIGRNGECCWMTEKASDALRAAVRRRIVDWAPEVEAAVDPIYAAIERHRQAFLEHAAIVSNTDRLEASLPAARRLTHSLDEVVETDDTTWVKHMRDLDRASDEMSDAAIALTDIRPKSRAAVNALLSYIENFNAGYVAFSKANRSEHYMWPENLVDDGLRNAQTGDAVEMPWAFWIMRNVRLALADLSPAKQAAAA